ncbi:siroheme decarboxylase subunit alpha [Desulfolutivibrio sulfoxidireducens]|uniref:siroheme decarboxylase subunit alpha n=1 Tax=Desulfolutivibrio sulfoxidireducens TaxID=2773299 RepID=UPI00159CF8DA|nr:AsnC family transcriptional regulator [Desulfolutivibrio sulfoxidireducens]QLA17393.1 AsnC family transcriptional regulator [Desulfolutivibrio sulfoxidireducens]QLA20990.1 AsnC family transcriptional regulator [Desulfolutivibrio sulfoxidireducens]
MDHIDRDILSEIQSGFPLSPRPYAAIGAKVGLTEAETLARVRALKQKGIIRRIGASFQSRKLGFSSTLCAATVPEDRLDAFVAEVNRHPGVTHNYLRAHPYNVWFTLIGPDADSMRDTLSAITRATGIGILNLPAMKLFKIKVDFSMKKPAVDPTSQPG